MDEFLFQKMVNNPFYKKCTLQSHDLVSEWTLICHTTMCRNAINVLYNPDHVTFDVWKQFRWSLLECKKCG